MGLACSYQTVYLPLGRPMYLLPFGRFIAHFKDAPFQFCRYCFILLRTEIFGSSLKFELRMCGLVEWIISQFFRYFTPPSEFRQYTARLARFYKILPETSFLSWNSGLRTAVYILIKVTNLLLLLTFNESNTKVLHSFIYITHTQLCTKLMLFKK